jgi:hypothetical protein
MREYHVRFRERFGVKLPLPTRLPSVTGLVAFLPIPVGGRAYGATMKLSGLPKPITHTICVNVSFNFKFNNY